MQGREEIVTDQSQSIEFFFVGQRTLFDRHQKTEEIGKESIIRCQVVAVSL